MCSIIMTAWLPRAAPWGELLRQGQWLDGLWDVRLREDDCDDCDCGDRPEERHSHYVGRLECLRGSRCHHSYDPPTALATSGSETSGVAEKCPHEHEPGGSDRSVWPYRRYTFDYCLPWARSRQVASYYGGVSPVSGRPQGFGEWGEHAETEPKPIWIPKFPLLSRDLPR
jgi:hypothetical protein